MLQTRQPWADVEIEPARPTAEQEEWLKAEGFREEPTEEPDQVAEDGAPKVLPPLTAVDRENISLPWMSPPALRYEARQVRHMFGTAA